MRCPACRHENPPAARRCLECDAALPDTIETGRVVAGRYAVLGHLGAGGMGSVYRAHDRKLDDVVALKVLRPRDEKAAARFRSEIKLARRVRHRNVCAIHEYAEDGELLFIAMELVEGRDLRQILQERGALTWEEAYDVALQAAEGLRAVHEAGVIHRDLKPANLMLDPAGVVRVMDFGIARAYGEEGQGEGHITSVGHVVGSPDYMSPEQIRSLPLDFRSDVYALAVVVYELFTGRAPFHAETPVATMARHLQERPPLEGPEASRLPAALIPVLRRALVKDPTGRLKDVPSFLSALRAAREALARQTTDETPGPAPALGAPGPATRPPPEVLLLVPFLAKGLRHARTGVRAEAARVLGEIGPLAMAAGSTLAHVALSDDSPEVRDGAARALRTVGTPAAGVKALAAPWESAGGPDGTPSDAPARTGPAPTPAPVPALRVRRSLAIAIILLGLSILGGLLALLFN